MLLTPTAFASGSRAAPVPVIFAAAGAPTNGLAVNPTGLSNSEPGTLLMVLAVAGVLARLALYWICVVAWAGMKLLLNWRTCATLPIGFPLVDHRQPHQVAGAVDQEAPWFPEIFAGGLVMPLNTVDCPRRTPAATTVFRCR
jgi:hypothetical protein